jgi:hypothetical protein
MKVMHLVAASSAHETRREGMILGLVMATVTWLFVALVDAMAGTPFHTFGVLGGVAAFTVVHIMLNVAYGLALVSVVHTSREAPSVIIGGLFVVLTFEFAIAMLTILLTHLGLGELAWLRIFGASVVGLLVGLLLLSRDHPLAARLQAAEEER